MRFIFIIIYIIGILDVIIIFVFFEASCIVGGGDGDFIAVIFVPPRKSFHPSRHLQLLSECQIQRLS